MAENQPQRNSPYSTFLPASSSTGPLQSHTVNQNGVPIAQMALGPQQLQNNRLSYIGSNTTSSSLAPTLNLPLSSNGINSTYGTLNSSVMINRDPSGTSCNQRGSNEMEHARPTALVSSYITSLNNSVSCYNTFLP